MSDRAARLKRLLAVRRLNEDLERRKLKVALSSLAEVETAMERQEGELAGAKVAAREALEQGDRGEWLMADAQGEVARWNRERLKGMLGERRAAAAAAMRRFVESRREHRQVKQLVEDAALAAGEQEGRRAQAAADDWFLSRRGGAAE